MPTAGRLAAAIALAVLGGIIAYRLEPAFPEGGIPGYWLPLCLGAGIWAGWVVIGKRTGRGYSSAVGNGITGTLAMGFWILFIMSFTDMIQKSLRRLYDGPMEALVNVFEIMTEYATILYSNDLAMVLAVGAVIVGVFSEFVAKRLP